jgi:uncharacterized membrane protein (Fun14 family)
LSSAKTATSGYVAVNVDVLLAALNNTVSAMLAVSDWILGFTPASAAI